MNSSNTLSLHRFPFFCFVIVFYCTTCVIIQHTHAFSPSSLTLTSSEQCSSIHNRRHHTITSPATTSKKRNSRLNSKSSPLDNDDDIQNQLAKARKLLKDAKAKLAAADEAAKEEGKEEENVKGQEQEKREAVMKTKNEETGLITTDGELMAELSEEEDWEVKALMDVFESESTKGRHDPAEKSWADRDVSASIFNMRMKLKDQDYRRVFDKRNYFIGEDN